MKKIEAEKAWKKRIHKTAGIYDADKALSDFKLALKAEIDKKFVIAGIKRDYLTVTISEILSLIDEVKPLEK